MCMFRWILVFLIYYFIFFFNHGFSSDICYSSMNCGEYRDKYYNQLMKKSKSEDFDYRKVKAELKKNCEIVGNTWGDDQECTYKNGKISLVCNVNDEVLFYYYGFYTDRDKQMIKMACELNNGVFIDMAIK